MNQLTLCATGSVVAGLAPVLVVGVAHAGPSEESSSPFNLSGLIFADAVSGSGDDWKGDETQADIRLAEFSLRYETESFIAVAGYDFGQNREWRDVGIIRQFDRGSLGFGYFKEPAALSKLSPQGGTLGLEAPRFGSTFGMGRRLGVHGSWQTDHLLFQGAVTNGSLDSPDATGRAPGQTAASVRVSTGIEHVQGVFHLGGYARWLDYDGSGFKLSEGPHSGIVNKSIYVNLTPSYRREADRSTLFGGEVAATAGRWFVSAEAAALSVDLPNGNHTVTGGALQASVALTGERRSYSPYKGVFKSIKPDRALGEGGYGAVELTARVDHLDLSPLIDGSSTEVGFGVIWTPRENVRVIARHEEEFGRGAMPDSRSLGIRVQLGF